MNKKLDVNSSQNSKNQKYFFLYDSKNRAEKIVEIINILLEYVSGFPSTMTIGSSFIDIDYYFKAVRHFDVYFLGLEEKEYNQIEIQHKKQFSIYSSFIFKLFFIGLFFFLLFFSPFRIYENFIFGMKLSFWELIFFGIIELIVVIITIIILIRLIFRMMDYLIPETLCIIQVIGLNLDLTRDDVIYRRDVKNRILYRMKYLERVTMLTPQRYITKKETSQQWIQEHFQNIADYIRERRRWLIAPNETTLDGLRRDFRKLAYYYLTGKYGAWEWQSFESPSEVVKPTRFQKIQETLIRFVGIILPLLIMAFYILFPGKFPDPNAEILKNLPYIFIAWLLVSLDITLKLGVIESLIKLITGLKDLSK